MRSNARSNNVGRSISRSNGGRPSLKFAQNTLQAIERRPFWRHWSNGRSNDKMASLKFWLEMKKLLQSDRTELFWHHRSNSELCDWMVACAINRQFDRYGDRSNTYVHFYPFSCLELHFLPKHIQKVFISFWKLKCYVNTKLIILKAS